jgi:hypothetical protein
VVAALVPVKRMPLFINLGRSQSAGLRFLAAIGASMQTFAIARLFIRPVPWRLSGESHNHGDERLSSTGGSLATGARKSGPTAASQSALATQRKFATSPAVGPNLSSKSKTNCRRLTMQSLQLSQNSA